MECLENELKENKAKLEDLDGEMEKICEAENKLKELQEQICAKDQEIDCLKSQLQDVSQREDQLKCFENELKEKCKQIEGSKMSSQDCDMLNDLLQEKCALQDKLGQQEHCLNRLLGEEKKLCGQICQLRNAGQHYKAKAEELEAHIYQLESQVNKMTSMEDPRHQMCRATIKQKICEVKQAYERKLQELANQNAQLNESMRSEVLVQEKMDLDLQPSASELNCSLESEAVEHKSKLQEVQEVLTAEVAAKHDEILRLKEDVKELEDKLVRSDQQTHFRDDIIRQLRKEVKAGRAKESLAEMLGLKGTPRAAMKDEIEHLSGVIEELKAQNLSLEARLGECNLPAVLTLRSKLNQAEGSLLAMFNKMDYIRRYLENLKGDEELSLKCGLEALLNELREDVEWSRQTRRNLSLDESTSVIVISHRSRSLPDNSLHRLPKTPENECGGANVTSKASPTSMQYSVLQDNYEESKSHIQIIGELENNFDETNKTIFEAWNSFKIWGKGSGDALTRNVEDIIGLSVEQHESLEKVVAQVSSLLEVEDDGACMFNFLQENLIQLDSILRNANLVSSSCDLGAEWEVDETKSISFTTSKLLADCISLVQDMRSRNGAQMPEYVRSCLHDVILLFETIMKNKKNTCEKLTTLKKQQNLFFQVLMKRMTEFDHGLEAYHSSADKLKGEIRRLCSALLSKDNEIQKQFKEVQDLKTLLNATARNDHHNEESLRKVVSTKDLQVCGNDDPIHNLRSLNYTLRRSKLSRSSPSISCSGEIIENLDTKFQELEGYVVGIKENVAAVLKYFERSREKFSEFNCTISSLVQTLAHTHEDIMYYKEAVTVNKSKNFNISSLDGNLNQACSKVEQLLNAIESFLCNYENPDLNLIRDSLKEKTSKLVYITDLIKRCTLQENASMKELATELDELKKKEIEKSEIIETLKERWENVFEEHCKLKDQYSNLRSQKEEMEANNLKVMEELQKKICSLQEASQSQPTESGDMKLVEVVRLLRDQNMKYQNQVTSVLRFIESLKKAYAELEIENCHLKRSIGDMSNFNEEKDLEIEDLHVQLNSSLQKIQEQIELQKVLSDEVEILKEQKMSMENSILAMQEIVNQKTDSANAEAVEILTGENKHLKLQNENNQKKLIELEHLLEQNKEEYTKLEAYLDGKMKELAQKNVCIKNLQLEKEELDHRLKCLVNKPQNQVFQHSGCGDVKRVEDLEETVQRLKSRISMLSEFIIERDEFIKLIENQLKASTDLLLEDSDKEKIVGTNPIAFLIGKYKQKLQHSMQQNCYLVNMVSKLQSMSYLILKEDECPSLKTFSEKDHVTEGYCLQ